MFNSKMIAQKHKELMSELWGTYLEKNCPNSNRHLLDCGGVKMLARMVWGTYAVKIEVQMGICLC